MKNLDLSSVVTFSMFTNDKDGNRFEQLIAIPDLTDKELKLHVEKTANAITKAKQVLKGVYKVDEFKAASSGQKQTITDTDACRIIERGYLIMSKLSLEASIRKIEISKYTQLIAERSTASQQIDFDNELKGLAE